MARGIKRNVSPFLVFLLADVQTSFVVVVFQLTQMVVFSSFKSGKVEVILKWVKGTNKLMVDLRKNYSIQVK